MAFEGGVRAGRAEGAGCQHDTGAGGGRVCTSASEYEPGGGSAIRRSTMCRACDRPHAGHGSDTGRRPAWRRRAAAAASFRGAGQQASVALGGQWGRAERGGRRRGKILGQQLQQVLEPLGAVVDPALGQQPTGNLPTPPRPGPPAALGLDVQQRRPKLSLRLQGRPADGGRRTVAPDLCAPGMRPVSSGFVAQPGHGHLVHETLRSARALCWQAPSQPSATASGGAGPPEAVAGAATPRYGRGGGTRPIPPRRPASTADGAP